MQLILAQGGGAERFSSRVEFRAEASVLPTPFLLALTQASSLVLGLIVP